MAGSERSTALGFACLVPENKAPASSWTIKATTARRCWPRGKFRISRLDEENPSEYQFGMTPYVLDIWKEGASQGVIHGGK